MRLLPGAAVGLLIGLNARAAAPNKGALTTLVLRETGCLAAPAFLVGETGRGCSTECESAELLDSARATEDVPDGDFDPGIGGGGLLTIAFFVPNVKLFCRTIG
jgi:hypothetical protein